MLKLIPPDTHKYHLKNRWHTTCFEKLNNLEWVDAFAFVCHGVKIGIRVSDSEIAEDLKLRLPISSKLIECTECDAIFSIIKGGKVVGSGIRKFHMLYHNHTELNKSHKINDVFERFESWLSITVGFLAPKHTFVHAGSVSYKGHAIIIPGKSFSGKSTLVSELLNHGADYLSDEFAILNTNGMVMPWAKPISMRYDETAKQINVDPSHFGAKILQTPVPLGLVIITKFKENAIWRPRSVSKGKALLGMLDNCLSGQLYPERNFKTLGNAIHGTKSIKSSRGEAKYTAVKILKIMDNLLKK
ncbi:hypothetical protein N8366_09210 [Amylibacter sp.]|nr:hypothetical protein [Amylibacter sp.]